MTSFRFGPFSRKQMKILTWWNDCSPVKDKDGIFADGAIRSGKTVVMSLFFVMWAMASFSGQNFAMCGKTIGSFRRNVLFWLKIMLRGRGYGVEDHRADNLLTVTKHGNTNYFYIFGGKDERSQDATRRCRQCRRSRRRKGGQNGSRSKHFCAHHRNAGVCDRVWRRSNVGFL